MVRYEKPGNARCGFEVWDAEHNCMGSCGEEAIGASKRRGGVPLCEEHFRYYQAVNGVHPMDIETVDGPKRL